VPTTLGIVVALGGVVEPGGWKPPPQVRARPVGGAADSDGPAALGDLDALLLLGEPALTRAANIWLRRSICLSSERIVSWRAPPSAALQRLASTHVNQNRPLVVSKSCAARAECVNSAT
jgi:hypothetical protein